MVFSRGAASSAAADRARRLLDARGQAPRHVRHALVIGAVSYCEYVASIWKGMARHFARQGLDVDFVLFTSYERQNAALLRGEVDVAWSGPLAHARLVRLAAAAPGRRRAAVVPLGMRDVDRGFATHVVARADAGIERLEDLAGRRVAAGTVDSPQAYVLPLAQLRAQLGAAGLASLTLLRYDRDVGKHGDTAHGETAALEALESGAAEAAFVSDLMWQRHLKDPADGRNRNADGRLRQLAGAPVPRFDHCQFSALVPASGDGDGALVAARGGRAALRRLRTFQRALFAMNERGHAEDARTMELEGLRAVWEPPRGGLLSDDDDAPLPDPRAGYERMLEALEAFGEPRVRWPGHLHSPERHPFRALLVDSRIVPDLYGC